MHLRFMQIVDYWAGVPLCFLLTLFSKFEELLWPKASARRKRLLFIELSEMGSAILAYPALKKACAQAGAENVYFLIFKANRESVDLLNLIPRENVIEIESGNFFDFTRTALQAIFRMRRLKLSAALDLELFSRCTAILSYLSGAAARAGFHNYTEEGLYRGDLFTHKIYYNPTLHMSQSFLALLDSLECETSERPLLKKLIPFEAESLPEFIPSEEEKIAAEKLLETKGFKPGAARLYLLNPDPGLLELRGWPAENYKALAERILSAADNHYVALIGLEKSRYFFEQFQRSINSDRLIDLTGSTPGLRELVSIIRLAECFITNDSGPAHFASLTRTKTVVLFGPETPLRYRPLSRRAAPLFAGLACSPCFSAANHRRSVCRNNICMQAISVEEVYAKVLA